MRHSICFNLKAIQKYFFWVISLVFLVACRIFSTPTTPTVPTVDVAATSTQAAATAIAQLTAIASNSTPSPTATHPPEKKLLPTLSPTPTQLPKFPLDGYVMLFIREDNLYFQDGNNLPVKLTHLGKKAYYYHKLSDDNQKAIFSRNDGIVYSINTDGTQEQIIATKVTNDVPPASQSGTFTGIVDFVPDTHQLLFETAVCESQEFRSPCSVSLFLVDTDTTAIKSLGNFGLAIQENSVNRSVALSPNGKMVAVGTAKGVDILTLDGKILRRNLLPYKPSTDTVLFSSLFWLPDSSGLIVALPNALYNSNAYSDFPASTLWRYTIDTNITAQIQLDPPHPMLDTFQVSPDGKWIVFGGLGNDAEVYLGNLTDKHLRLFGDAWQVYFSWAPDSKHFVTSPYSVLGAVDTPALTPICQLWGNWIDADHFLCGILDEDELRIRMAEIEGETLKIYDIGFDKNVEFSIFLKTKFSYSAP